MNTGRFVLLKGKVDGNLFTFYNIDVPPGSEPNFCIQILNRIAIEAEGTLECGGDFNITLNPLLDLSGTRISQSKKVTKKINSVLSELGLIDVWRFLNPSVRDYTFFSPPHSPYSRIDYFFIFGKDSGRVRKCQIGTMEISDHSPMYLSLSTSNRRKITHW